MLGRNQTENNTTLIFMRDVSSKKALELKEQGEYKGKTGVPYFTVTKKVDGEWKEVGKEGEFSGTLKKIKIEPRYDENKAEHKQYIDKYGNSDVVTVEVEDAKARETYVWKTGFNIASKTLFNKLLNLTSPDNIEISIWKDQKGYDKLNIKQNGQKVEWKYDLVDLPKPREFTGKGGKPEKDYTEVDKFFSEKLKEFKIRESEVKSAPSQSEDIADEEVGDSEIPF